VWTRDRVETYLRKRVCLKGNAGGKGRLKSRVQQLDETMDIKRHLWARSVRRRSQWAITKESRCVFLALNWRSRLFALFQSPYVAWRCATNAYMTSSVIKNE
jgi:hypothetical protein